MEPADVTYAIGLSPAVFEPSEFEEKLETVLAGFLEDSGIKADDRTYETLRSYVCAQRARDATLFTFWRAGGTSTITAFYETAEPEHRTLSDLLDQR